MSALGQGMSGRAGPNTAYKIINDAINRDIDLQKEELRTRKDVLRNKNNLFANMMARFGDERSAEIATHQAGLAAAKQKVEALQTMHKGENAQAVISGMLGKIEADAIKNGTDLAKLRGSMAVQEANAAARAAGSASGSKGTIASALAKLDKLPETFKKVGRIEGAIASTLSGFGLGGLLSIIPGTSDAEFYEDARNLIAKEITRAFDGGRPTDKDFAIILARLPTSMEGKERGVAKIANLRKFLTAEAGPGGRFKPGELEAKWGKTLTAEQIAVGKKVEGLAGKEDWEFFTPEGGKKKRPRIAKHEGKLSSQDIVSPLAAGFEISSGHGMRKHPITGGKKMHKGTDWAAPKNTPVVSMLDGTVTYAGNQGGKTGYVVKIKDESGRETKFFHLNPGSLKVKKGQKVKAGQHVAGVGNTGGSTGYHLHAELLIGGKHVDLADYLGDA
jgi:murein DD-endopeptidase MepM/ murein hydrolase activator NlpD